MKRWQPVVEVKYLRCCCLLQGLFAKAGVELRSSLYPTEKRDAVFRGIGREGDKQGQVFVPVSQLRSLEKGALRGSLLLLEEHRPKR